MQSICDPRIVQRSKCTQYTQFVEFRCCNSQSGFDSFSSFGLLCHSNIMYSFIDILIWLINVIDVVMFEIHIFNILVVLRKERWKKKNYLRFSFICTQYMHVCVHVIEYANHSNFGRWYITVFQWSGWLMIRKVYNKKKQKYFIEFYWSMSM